MKSGKLHIKFADALYFASYILILFCSFYNTTTFPGIFGLSWIYTTARCMMLGFIALKMIQIDKFTAGQLLFWGGLTILALATLSQSLRGSILDYMVLVIGSKGIDKTKIVKCYFIESMILTLITLAACGMGIIIDYVTVRTATNTLRHSFGFVYATDFAAHLFFIYLSYQYIRKERKRRWSYVFEGIIVAVVVFLLDAYCDARLSEIMILLTYLAFLLYRFRKIDFNKRVLRCLSVCSMPVCAIMTIVVTMLYDGSNPFLVLLDEILFSRRLYVAKRVITKYGFTLLGQDILMQGMGYKVNGFNAEVGITYLDSSYIQIMMLYGVVLLVLLLILFTLLTKESIKIGDSKLTIVMILISIACIINQYLIYMAYNPFALLIGPLLMYKSKGKSINAKQQARKKLHI